MDKSSKMYKKAMNYYHDGKIDKAMELCEKSISMNIRNAAALNLQGLLYYLQGELEGAKRVWQLNIKVNNDGVSKKYMKDSKQDEEREKLYIDAAKHMKQLKINEALELLHQCEQSHYNYINVHNQLAKGYIHKGEYEKAAQYIKEVLKVDIRNSAAKEQRKMLLEYGAFEKEKPTKWIFLTLLILFIALGGWFANKNRRLFLGTHKTQEERKETQEKIQPKIEIEKKDIVQKEEKKESPQHIPEKKEIIPVKKEEASATKEKPPVPPKEKFPYKELKQSIGKRNLDQIYAYVHPWEGKEMAQKEKELFLQGRNILIQEGTPYFYAKGGGYVESYNYAEGKKYLLKAYEYGKGHELYQHVNYLLAVSLDHLKETNAAMQYYESYEKSFPQGYYIKETLYKLAILNKEKDLKKAKTYAQRLTKQYPNSQYNNMYIQEILRK